MRRWLLALGKTVLVAFLIWHMGVGAMSSLPDRSQSTWVQSVRATVLPYTDPYAYWTGQWQTWGMFSQGSVQRIFKHSFEAWDPATQTWFVVEPLGFHDLPFFAKALQTALLRSLENEKNWRSRERYLQLKCIELKRPVGEWVRMGYDYFDMPLDNVNGFQPSTWENFEPEWIDWPDSHWTKCPDPESPMDTWPVDQNSLSSSS